MFLSIAHVVIKCPHVCVKIKITILKMMACFIGSRAYIWVVQYVNTVPIRNRKCYDTIVYILDVYIVYVATNNTFLTSIAVKCIKVDVAKDYLE